MSRHTHRPSWLFASIVLIVLAAFLCIGQRNAALAAGPTVKLTLGVLPGPLTATLDSVSPSSETADSEYRTVTYQLQISVIDATGSGNGWNLELGATLPPGTTAALTQVNAACTEEAHCSVLRNRITYPAIMQGNDAAPVQFFNAPVNTGMGAFTITPTLSLSIPASTPASSLKSTLTLTITSGS